MRRTLLIPLNVYLPGLPSSCCQLRAIHTYESTSTAAYLSCGLIRSCSCTLLNKRCCVCVCERLLLPLFSIALIAALTAGRDVALYLFMDATFLFINLRKYKLDYNFVTIIVYCLRIINAAAVIATEQ